MHHDACQNHFNLIVWNICHFLNSDARLFILCKQRNQFFCSLKTLRDSSLWSFLHACRKFWPVLVSGCHQMLSEMCSQKYITWWLWSVCYVRSWPNKRLVTLFLHRSNYLPWNINTSRLGDQHEIVQQYPDPFILQMLFNRGNWQACFKLKSLTSACQCRSRSTLPVPGEGFLHVEAILFYFNTMGATLPTFAELLKLFSRFPNRPQFILLRPGRCGPASAGRPELPKPNSNFKFWWTKIRNHLIKFVRKLET
jgi:hypothetical protein